MVQNRVSWMRLLAVVVNSGNLYRALPIQACWRIFRLPTNVDSDCAFNRPWEQPNEVYKFWPMSHRKRYPRQTNPIGKLIAYRCAHDDSWLQTVRLLPRQCASSTLHCYFSLTFQSQWWQMRNENRVDGWSQNDEQKMKNPPITFDFYYNLIQMITAVTLVSVTFLVVWKWVQYLSTGF